MENGKTIIPHRFIKGKSGNPAGRPKGSKNQITIMKIALEGNLRKKLEHDAQDILQKAIDMAKAGDGQMIKLLVDKMIPTSRSVDDEPTRERVQVFIDRLGSERPAIQGRVIEEGEFPNGVQ